MNYWQVIKILIAGKIKRILTIALFFLVLTYCPTQPCFQEFGSLPPPPPAIEVQKVNRGARSLVVEATAYTHTGDTTCTGVWPKAGRTIAADPSIIPLGSEVYIEGFGYRVVEDTGGDIQGNKIDIFMDTRKECINWGRRVVEIKIIKNTKEEKT